MLTWGQDLAAKGQAREEGTERPGVVARPHLHRVVAQLDGLVDALHDLVEACGEEKQSRNFLFSLVPSHPQGRKG